MRLLAIVSLLALGACQSLGSIFGKDAAAFLDEATAKAGQVADDTADAVAMSLEAYCDNVPSIFRDTLRSQISSRMVRWDAGDLCVPKAE